MRTRIVLGAAMPKAAIDKKNGAIASDDKIWSAGKLGLSPIPETKAPEYFAKPHFRTGVLTANPRHAIASLGCR